MKIGLVWVLVWFVAPAVGAATPISTGQEALGIESVMLDLPRGLPVSGARLDRLTEEVAGVIRCPVCQGVSVAESPATTAVDMKREVRSLLAEGYTARQVLSYFEQAYGEFIRLEPKRQGFNWLVWLAPFAGLAAGVAMMVGRLRAAAAYRRISAPDGHDLT